MEKRFLLKIKEFKGLWFSLKEGANLLIVILFVLFLLFQGGLRTVKYKLK